MNSLQARYLIIGGLVLIFLATGLENYYLASSRNLIGHVSELKANLDAPEKPDRPSGVKPYKPRKPKNYSPNKPTKRRGESDYSYQRRLRRYNSSQERYQKRLKKYKKELAKYNSRSGEWKEYDQKLKEWKEEMEEYREENKDKKKRTKKIEKEASRAFFTLLQNATTVFFLKFLGGIGLLIGLAYLLLYGTEVERAAALVMAGILVPRILVMKDYLEAMGLGFLGKLF